MEPVLVFVLPRMVASDLSTIQIKLIRETMFKFAVTLDMDDMKQEPLAKAIRQVGETAARRMYAAMLKREGKQMVRQIFDLFGQVDQYKFSPSQLKIRFTLNVPMEAKYLEFYEPEATEAESDEDKASSMIRSLNDHIMEAGPDTWMEGDITMCWSLSEKKKLGWIRSDPGEDDDVSDEDGVEFIPVGIDISWKSRSTAKKATRA